MTCCIQFLLWVVLNGALIFILNRQEEMASFTIWVLLSLVAYNVAGQGIFVFSALIFLRFLASQKLKITNEISSKVKSIRTDI